MLRLVGIVLVVLLAMAGPAAAGTAQQPEITDACGETSAEQVTAAWSDICRGWFEGGGSQPLSVTLQLAGELSGRAQDYVATYTIGDCRYQLVHDEGTATERTVVGPASVGGSTVDELIVGCGQMVERPCELPEELNTTCHDAPVERRFKLPNGAFSFSGSTVRWQVSFTGALAELAAAHHEDAVLRRPLAVTSTDLAAISMFGLSYCYGNKCGSVLSDYAYGKDYTVPQS